MKMLQRGLIVVVFTLLLAVFNSYTSLAVGGCYVYPQGSEELYCVSNTEQSAAVEDCAEHAGCNMQDDFLPGYDCSQLVECQQVICSADCQTHARGICEQLGGEEVTDETYAAWCSPGCCKIGSEDLFCQFGLNRFQCEQRARQLSYDPGSFQVVYDNSPGMNLNECNSLYCQIDIEPAQLYGIVQDTAGNPVADAIIVLEGTTRQTATDASGNYAFADIRPGTIVVRISAAGYVASVLSISLHSAASLEQNFILASAEGISSIAGTARSNGQPVADATITWSGPTSGRVFTDRNGIYYIADLPAGDYQLTASKVGYSPAPGSVTLYTGEEEVNFALTAIAQQGLRGVTYADEINNGVADTDTEFRYGVRLYVDGTFRGFSQYPFGDFSLAIAPGQHQISATYQDFFFGPETITVAEGQTFQDLLLTRYIGVCTPPNPLLDVAVFSASPIPGEKKVLLQWQRPCPEVIGYIIEKRSAAMNIELLSASVTQSTLTDQNVQWGETYIYTIRAIYREGASTAAAEASITVGDAECAGHFQEATGWDTFCLVGDLSTRKTVWACSNENQLLPSLNCAERDGEGEDFYCGAIAAGVAECKDAGVCSIAGYPFGLYYSREVCYGTAQPPAENFCYYDYSDSIINQCQSCLNIESCFEYRSRDACEFNNCLDTACQWVDAAANAEPIIDYGLINLPGLVTAETGQGYCVKQDYPDDDTCSLCSPSSTLFENYYCTAEVCSNLGRCFANTDVSSCNECGDAPSRTANCYTYNTELECTAGRPISRSPFGEIALSEDRCGWGRCLWQAAPDNFASGACVKDGDGSVEDDCAAFAATGERRGCEIDNSPPRTLIIPAGVAIISLASPNVAFFGDDDFHAASSQNNKLGLLGFCAVSADPNAQSVCTEFSEVHFPGNLKQETVTVNLIASAYLQKSINGEPYRLKFYSKDKYFNQETVQETFIFVDNVAPEFEINQQIETAGDITDLKAYLEGITEPMGCTFTLAQILPQGSSTQTKMVSREEQNKEASFIGLAGVIYQLNVTCTDAVNNKNTKTKNYVFDLEERIMIINPALDGIAADSSIRFEIETIAGAQCSLYQAETNTKIVDFVSDEDGKQHHTPAIPGLVQGEYPGTYKAVCRELFSDETYEDYFHFTVDFTPPATAIILQEGQREERPSGFGWEEFFIKEVDVDFECIADGFPCDRMYYCLGEGCDYIRHPGYTEYQSTLEIINSTRICYYSTDTAGNMVYSPLCGNIVLDGYGIMLLQPELHYYHEEQRGVSNSPTFIWEFITKVPTEECRFDFNPAFSWDATPNFKILLPNNNYVYTVPEFPKETGATPYDTAGSTKAVYVKCRNAAAEIGPEQKMNLEYDPSAPSITDAHAEPEILLEGTTVELFATTDDKTLCKYSNQGHADYELMNFAFPGAEADLPHKAGGEPKILGQQHQDTFSVAGLIGLERDYLLSVLCKNGASDISGLSQISFRVDYSQLGGILSAWPQGEHLAASDVTLAVETSKSGLCEYGVNGTFLRMGGQGSRQHSKTLSALNERYYQFPFRCTMGDHLVEAELFFTIDRTPPTISRVDDGSYSCGAASLNVMAYSDEQNITAYAYEVYDTGAAAEPSISPISPAVSSNTSFFFRRTTFGNLRTLILNGTAAPELPIRIPTASLNESRRYIIQVRAQDAAGWSQPAESDGILVVAANHSQCLNDTTAPLVRVASNDSCTAKLIELHCEDAVGCQQLRYGQALTQESCTPSSAYLGQKISFGSGGWLCYYVEDYQGRNHSATVQVQSADADGDSITNSCDQCASTAAGVTVDDAGCSLGQLPEGEQANDADGDGLPDYWEKSYDSIDCPLSFASVDTDQNTIPDGEEDYDSDGLANYEEYRAGRNPCLVDTSAGKEEKPPAEIFPSLTQEKKQDIVAWIFFILGWLMVLGGTGYLIYYYRYAPKSVVKGVGGVSPAAAFDVSRASAEKPSIVEGWKQKLQQARRGSLEKRRERQRREIFSIFNKSSKEIPHLGEALKKKAPPLQTVEQAAKSYTKHKQEIAPGLRREEKDIFDRLEEISKKAQKQDIKHAVSKREAEDIFMKLRALSRKRKK